MTKTDVYFRRECADAVRREIANASGNEVLFFGWTDDDDLVKRVEVVARGNDASVAVPLQDGFVPDVVIHNHPEGPLSPSTQDVRISSVLAQRGVGFFIVDNEADELYVVVEPVKKIKRRKLDTKRLLPLVSKDGPLEERLDRFEEREGQRDMIRAVSETFNEDAVALIEAGTGIGKSLAYLIPSIRWSIDNHERVVVSTNTINLQEQLLCKDLPSLFDLFEQGFSYILMKGRGNYVCINRVEEASGDMFAFIDEGENEEFAAIKDWIRTTADGSLSDLTFVPKPALWEKVNSQTETCLGGECAYFGRCFVNRVKRRAVTSNIVVTNHHYLLADAAMTGLQTSILPSYERVIFDEAHNIEDSATSLFSRKITLPRTIRLLGRLYTGGKSPRGYLVYLSRKKDGKKTRRAEEIKKTVSGLKREAEDLFTALKDFLDGMRRAERPGLGTGEGNGYKVTVEIGEEVKNHPLWSRTILRRIGDFYRTCGVLAAELSTLRADLDKTSDTRAAKQIEGFVSRILEYTEILDTFLEDNDQEWVRWLEGGGKEGCGINVAPVDVGDMLHKVVFSRVKSAVLTSATLTVDGSFDFLKHRLSLPDSVGERCIASPFDWDRQVRVLVPVDTPRPDEPGYEEEMSGYIRDILERTGGKAFVLFTSHRMLKEISDRLKQPLASLGITVYTQGEDSRRNLLERFKRHTSSVLFGTESFWEGVDAPGETLECVIIVKLPFRVPTEPVVRARLKRIEAEGKNSFYEYTLPLAVIKLRQGVGRLIRNTTDRGVVAVMDRRVLSKSYGRVFLRSLETADYKSGERATMMDEITRFFTDTP
ncbi:MAG: DEAD/DEAH box helicase family protein [Spirochaetes bacterium]|nr:DEAD/DEAH box helicase family protein [Spirochaetota bacterium]